MSRSFATALLISALALTGGAWAAKGESVRPPRDFLRTAVVGDNGEIALARLAGRRALSAQVRSFARTLQDDHTRSRQQGLDLIRAAGRPAVVGLAPEAEAELHKLRGLSGTSFDREFVRFMAEDHRKDISDYRAQAMRRQGRASRLAQMTVPMLRKHLRLAEALAPTVGLRNQARLGGHAEPDAETQPPSQN